MKDEQLAVTAIPQRYISLLKKKFPTKNAFLSADLLGFGAKSSAHMLSIIDANSRTRLNLAGLRSLLGDKFYFLHNIEVADVDSRTHGDVEPSGREDLNKPIVVASDGTVIDGRHRVELARRQGVNTLSAYIPADLFYSREMS